MSGENVLVEHGLNLRRGDPDQRPSRSKRQQIRHAGRYGSHTALSIAQNVAQKDQRKIVRHRDPVVRDIAVGHLQQFQIQHDLRMIGK